MNLNLVKSGSNQLIHGVVNVRSAEYTEDISIPDLVRRASRNGSGGTSRRSKEGIALDIKIRANRSIRLTNNLGDVLASSELTLSGTLEDPVLLGDLVIEEGELYFAGNDYEITRGNLVFNDPTQRIPYLNFEATTEIREYVIDVSLQGPADNFNFSFRSDPPLSTTSVVSLLAAGQTQEEIFGSEATGQTSSSTLAIYGTGALAGRTLETFLQPETSRLLGLERFAIDPFVDSSRGRDPGARITIGKQVNADLSITLITSLSADLTGQTLIFQYELTDWLTAVGTRQEDGSVAIDFKLRKRF
jgi:translocation and assembly module TamB